MSATVHHDYISILIVGKTGNGKSRTGNTILGRRAFEAKANTTSTTKPCQKEVSKVQGQNAVVVDSPGLADTDMRTDQGLLQLSQEVTDILSKLENGVDAICIVLKFGNKLTEEDKTVFQQLEAIFGGPEFIAQYGVLVVTHADICDQEENDGMSIEMHLKSQTGRFQEMLQKCSNRLVVLDNKTKDESVCFSQLKRLLDIVNEMKSTPNRYNSNMFKMAKKVRDEALAKAQKPFIDEKTDNALRIVLQELNEMPPDSTDTQKLLKMKQELQEHHKALIEQDKGTGVLEDTISKVSALETACDSKITAIERKLDLESVTAEVSRRISDLQMNLKKENEGKSRYLMGALGFGLGALLTGALMLINPTAAVAQPAITAFITKQVTKQVLIRAGTTLLYMSSTASVTKALI